MGMQNHVRRRRGTLVSYTIVQALVLVAFGLLFAPLAAAGQAPGKVPRIGLIRAASPPDPNSEAFRQGLRELGYVEGQNIVIEYRWAEGKPERIPEFTAELVRLKVDVLVTFGERGGFFAKQATSTIPIVVPAIQDPVGAGLVASLAHPGGNLTGLSIMGPEMAEKRMQLLKESFPRISRVAVIRDPASAGTDLRNAGTAAKALGLQLQVLEARDLNGFESALAAAKKGRAQALDILPSGIFYANRARIVDLVAKTRLPAMYENKDFVTAGGLMAYGPNVAEVFRRAATYVDKILKGAKPADLPVEQPTRFEFVINMKTAKSLGLTFPQIILFQTTEMIQ
jgi:putative ABC transport system substrate-binding protein